MIEKYIKIIQSMNKCNEVKKERNCTQHECENCSICYEIGTCEEVSKMYKDLPELLDELDSYRKHIFSGDITTRMLREEYKRGYLDCQNLVENKCRKLGIDYTLIFTEESNG